jgi:hypothetical protein
MIVKIVTLYLFFICLVGCNSIQKQNNYNQILDSLILDINNDDYKKIGFKYEEDDESIGVKSIIIKDSVIYLLDVYHSNIKRINLVTGELESSKPFSEKRVWLRDLIVFKKSIFIFSDIETNYILDLNLNLIKTFELPIGSKYYYKTNNDTLLIYNMGEVLKINDDGILLSRKKEFIDILKLAHGKEYSIINKVIYTKYGDVHLKREFPYTWKEYYDAVNIDFNERNLVFFETNPYKLKIFIKKYD